MHVGLSSKNKVATVTMVVIIRQRRQPEFSGEAETSTVGILFPWRGPGSGCDSCGAGGSACMESFVLPLQSKKWIRLTGLFVLVGRGGYNNDGKCSRRHGCCIEMAVTSLTMWSESATLELGV